MDMIIDPSLLQKGRCSYPYTLLPFCIMVQLLFSDGLSWACPGLALGCAWALGWTCPGGGGHGHISHLPLLGKGRGGGEQTPPCS